MALRELSKAEQRTGVCQAGLHPNSCFPVPFYLSWRQLDEDGGLESRTAKNVYHRAYFLGSWEQQDFLQLITPGCTNKNIDSRRWKIQGIRVHGITLRQIDASPWRFCRGGARKSHGR